MVCFLSRSDRTIKHHLIFYCNPLIFIVTHSQDFPFFMNIEPSPAQQSLSSATNAMHSNPQVQACLDVVHEALLDVKAKDILQFDVSTISNVADAIIIASGTSTRHVKALADNVAEEARKAGFRPLGVEGERDAEWILVDLGFVVVHVMLPTARKFYDLESLWRPAN